MGIKRIYRNIQESKIVEKYKKCLYSIIELLHDKNIPVNFYSEVVILFGWYCPIRLINENYPSTEKIIIYFDLEPRNYWLETVKTFVGYPSLNPLNW